MGSEQDKRKALDNLANIFKSRANENKEDEDGDYLGVNQVLIYQFKKQAPTFYVPAYIRMKVNRVSDINYIEGSAAIETDIRLWVMIKQFPEVIQKEILNLAKIDINNKDSLLFEDIIEPTKMDPSYKKNISKHAQGLLITQQMSLDIESDPFWSPFETVNLIAGLEIKKIMLGDFNPNYLSSLKPEEKSLYDGACVQFNFIDAHPFLQFAFGEVNNLGSFDICESRVDMEFTADAGGNQSEDQDNGDNKYYEEAEEVNPLDWIGDIVGLKNKIRREKFSKGTLTPDAYQHGRILIPLYKYPATTIINLFLPFYMVAILSLGVFFQANDMSNRSASLATFQLAYIAFFPTIRETLPETPKLVFTEILIYLQACVLLICFFYSLNINGVEDYQFNYSTDIVFLISVGLTGLNMLVVIIMMLLHKCKWEPQYNRLPDGAIQAMQQQQINTDDNNEWWNPACEEEFKDPIEMKLVRPFIGRKKNIKRKGSVNANPEQFNANTSLNQLK